MVMGNRPATKSSPIQTPLYMWSLDVVCCALKQGIKSTLSQSTQLKLGTGFLWGLTCDGLVSHIGGVNDSHPLSTTETGDKHRPYAPNGMKKDLTTCIYTK